MTECEVCYDNIINNEVRCKICNKCICNKCCMNFKETNLKLEENTENIKISYKCPFCRDEVNLTDINEKSLCLEMTKKMIKENEILKNELNKQHNIINKQKETIDKNIINTYVVKELNICLHIQRNQRKKTFKVDYLETILNRKGTTIF